MSASSRIWYRMPIIVAFIPATVAFCLRFYGLSDKPLWLDEVITHVRAMLPISDLLASSFHNKHFPTYFLLVRAFDASIIDEWLLRLPSVLFGTITILLVAMVATEIKSARAGLAAGTIMALAPIDVQFGQEARPYTLASCLIMLALWGLVRIARQSEPAVPGLSQSKDACVSWVAYIIGTIAALYVLLVAVCWLISSNVAFAFTIRDAKSERSKLIRKWGLVQAIIVLAWLPGLIAICLGPHRDPLDGHRWIPPSTLEHVWSVIGAAYLYRASDITTFTLLPTPVPWLGMAFVGLALLGAWHLRADIKNLSIIGLAAITMPIMLSILSIFQPFWITRYLLWSTAPFFILAGAGLASLPRWPFSIAAASLAVAGIINLVPYYRSETKPRWDLAAAYLAANIQSADTIVTNDGAASYVLAAYGERYHLDRTRIAAAHDVSATVAQLASQRSLWIIYGRTGQGVMSGEDAYLHKWPIGKAASKIRFGRNIVAIRLKAETTRSASQQGPVK